MSQAVRELPPIYVLGDLVSTDRTALAWRTLLPRLRARGVRFEARRFWSTEADAQRADQASIAAIEAIASRRVPLGSPILTMDAELAVHAHSLVPEGGALLLLDSDAIHRE